MATAEHLIEASRAISRALKAGCIKPIPILPHFEYCTDEEATHYIKHTCAGMHDPYPVGTVVEAGSGTIVKQRFHPIKLVQP
jgi:hypothetical protein